MTKNGPEFLIGWRDFPLEKDDTWEPKPFLTGSEHMVCETCFLTHTGLVVELEDLKIKTRLTNEKFASVKGECEI